MKCHLINICCMKNNRKIHIFLTEQVSSFWERGFGNVSSEVFTGLYTKRGEGRRIGTEIVGVSLIFSHSESTNNYACAENQNETISTVILLHHTPLADRNNQA